MTQEPREDAIDDPAKQEPGALPEPETGNDDADDVGVLNADGTITTPDGLTYDPGHAVADSEPEGEE